MAQVGPELSAADRERYARHTIIPEIGNLGQRRISNAKVLCVGAGGLGSPVLLYLAAAGVGTLGIVDFDVVDESNLQRQVIHRHSDIGRSKVESAKARIEDLNPGVNVEIHQFRLDTENVLDLFSHYDVIVDGTDNFASRYLINDACVILNKPCVVGSIFRFDGQSGVFWSEHGPCYRCVFPGPPPFELAPNCAESGVLGTLCGLIGSIQATETLKLITGIGSPLVGSLIMCNGLDSTFAKIEVGKDPKCSMCGENANAQLLEDYEEFCGAPNYASELTAQQLAMRLSTGEPIQLIDVREKYEWDEGHIDGAVLIPQAEFYDGRAQKKIASEIPIVLYCHLGVRSAHALNALKHSGYERVSHLLGGIVSWDDYVRNG